MHFRVDRFYTEGGLWRCMTREGRDLGPFVTKRDAEQELALYIRITESPAAFGGYGQPVEGEDAWAQSFAG